MNFHKIFTRGHIFEIVKYSLRLYRPFDSHSIRRSGFIKNVIHNRCRFANGSVKNPPLLPRKSCLSPCLTSFLCPVDCIACVESGLGTLGSVNLLYSRLRRTADYSVRVKLFKENSVVAMLPTYWCS